MKEDISKETLKELLFNEVSYVPFPLSAGPHLD